MERIPKLETDYCLLFNVTTIRHTLSFYYLVRGQEIDTLLHKTTPTMTRYIEVPYIV